METACIYARYSSTAQGDGYSIEAQIFACKQHAERNNLVIVKEYIDEAKTGLDSSKRNSFQEMIADAKSIEKPFDFILVYDYERFGRSKVDQVNYKSELKFLGINVISITQPIDHSSPESVLLESIYEGLAESYSRKLSRNVKRGMVEAAKRGFWTGGYAPLGYSLKKLDNGKRKLIINKETSPIIKKIFKLYASEKHGLRNIAIIINNEFGLNKNPTTIKDILRNKRYIGSMVFGKRQDHNKKFLSQKSDIIETKKCHPSIISAKTFNKVQILLDQRKRIDLKSKPYKDLLSGVMQCGKCGSAVVGFPAKGGKYTYYTCIKRRKNNGCDMRAVNSDKIEPKIFEFLNKHFYSDAYIKKMIKGMAKAENSKGEEIDSSIMRHSKKLETLEKKKKKLLMLVEDTDVEMDDISSRLTEIKKQIVESSYNIKIENEKKKILKETSKMTTEEELKKMQAFIQELLVTSKSNQLIKTLIRTITLKDDSISVELHVGKEISEFSLESSQMLSCGGPCNNKYEPFVKENPLSEAYDKMKIKREIRV
mgnify:FL=1